MADIFKSLKEGISPYFKSLRQGVFPSYLGVDIGTTSIKAVEVRQGKRLPEIVNYGVLESSGYLVRANQALQTSTLKLFERETTDLLKLLISKMGARTTSAISSLPIFSTFTTILDFPEMSTTELNQAITFQARQYIPLPLSEVALDWIKVGEFKDDRGLKHQQILLISVTQEQIRKYQEIFKEAGLRLGFLEIEGLSLARLFGGLDPTPTIVVDVGSRSTSTIFLEAGRFKFASQSDFAGATLTQALSSSLSVNPARAEELKKEKGVSAAGPNYELSTIMMPFLDAIINETKQAHYKYREQFPDALGMERVILSGGGANLIGAERYFEKALNLPVARADSFSKFEYPPEMAPFASELGPVLSVALGLTLKEFQ